MGTEQKKIRFLMIGGFLGAGKTTTIARLANAIQASGESVGLVTNDQAYNLVDTQSLRSQGFDVGEVPGACFCCKFDDLMSTVSGLTEGRLPDWIIAEPVGSCTDLYATVIQPMRELFGDRFELGPLIVLLKPEHGRKILVQDQRRGFSPKAEYIFLKQLEEADVIAINKIDKLDDATREQLADALQQRFPDVPILALSARVGHGLEQLLGAARGLSRQRNQMMDVDYDVYAEGEAELGWLNCQVTASASQPFELDRLVLGMVEQVGARLVQAGCEIAHLKILGQTLTESSVANRVDSESPAELSLASEIETTSADLLVNARVAADPDQLTAAVDSAVRQLADEMDVRLQVGNVQSFRPAKPEPTHRVR